jgi:uncharacterized protein YndB with AHSA1/START domain
MAEPIVVETTVDASASTVWKALTDREQMKKWYFDIEGFKPEPGFEFQFTGGTEEKTYLHLCRITEVIPMRKLAHTWRYEGYEGDTLVSFELSPKGEQTGVKLTHEGLESFPSSNPDFKRENFVGGWTHIIQTALKDFVEGRSHAEA